MNYNTLVKTLVEELLTEAPKINILGLEGDTPFTTNVQAAFAAGWDEEGRPHLPRMVHATRQRAAVEGQIPIPDKVRAYASNVAGAISPPKDKKNPAIPGTTTMNPIEHRILVPVTSALTRPVTDNYPYVPREEIVRGMVGHEIGHILNTDTTDLISLVGKKTNPDVIYPFEAEAHDTGEELLNDLGIPTLSTLHRDIGLTSYIPTLKSPQFLTPDQRNEALALAKKVGGPNPNEVFRRTMISTVNAAKNTVPKIIKNKQIVDPAEP